MSLTVFYSSSIYCPTCFHDPAPHFKLDPDGGMEICETCEHVYQYAPTPTTTPAGKPIWHVSNLITLETGARHGLIMPGDKVTSVEQLRALPVGTVLICEEYNTDLEKSDYYPIMRVNRDDWRVKADLYTYLTGLSSIENLLEETAFYVLKLPQQGEQQ